MNALEQQLTNAVNGARKAAAAPALGPHLADNRRFLERAWPGFEPFIDMPSVVAGKLLNSKAQSFALPNSGAELWLRPKDGVEFEIGGVGDRPISLTQLQPLGAPLGRLEVLLSHVDPTEFAHTLITALNYLEMRALVRD
jgi:hypothetical protein